MAVDFDKQDLVGKLLVSMPKMSDPRFNKSVIVIIHHDPEGTVGMVVNNRAGIVQYGFAPKGSKKLGKAVERLPVYFGGPVDKETMIILHTNDLEKDSETVSIGDQYCITHSAEILAEHHKGNGPRHLLIALGYSGWGPGQLVQELQQNVWLVCEAREELVFEIEDEQNGARRSSQWEFGQAC